MGIVTIEEKDAPQMGIVRRVLSIVPGNQGKCLGTTKFVVYAAK